MNNVYDQVPWSSCFGCGGCSQVCPRGIIEMRYDEEGFSKPVVEYAKCIDCGQCTKLCPSLHSDKYLKNFKHSYIVQNTDKKHTRKSASGGAFLGIASSVISDREGLVFGASLCSDMIVRHKSVDSVQNLRMLQNSKYVQSEIGNSFQEVKKNLNEGNFVFFTGTPCQVSGLYSYLRRDYPNLLTADIICHGVPSPKWLQYYCALRGRESKERVDKVIDLKFRRKQRFGRSKSLFLMTVTKRRSGTRVYSHKHDPYFNSFLQGLNFRESCYRCPFAQKRRVGDFTIGDCDSQSDYPDFHPEESNSTLLISSEKGEEYWNEYLKFGFDYADLDLDKEAERNKQLLHPYPRPTERDNFYSGLYSSSLDELVKKYGKESTLSDGLKIFFLLNIPSNILQRILNFLHRVIGR